MFKLFSFYIFLIIFSLPVFAENTFITKIENLAERGFSDAQYNLARIYANGESVDQDLIAAEYWFRKSAEQGNLDAQYQLGRMYDSGLGVSINKKEAFKWYSLSAEQGSIDAQYNLGLAYRLGIGVEQSFTKSLKKKFPIEYNAKAPIESDNTDIAVPSHCPNNIPEIIKILSLIHI